MCLFLLIIYIWIQTHQFPYNIIKYSLKFSLYINTSFIQKWETQLQLIQCIYLQDQFSGI